MNPDQARSIYSVSSSCLRNLSRDCATKHYNRFFSVLPNHGLSSRSSHRLPRCVLVLGARFSISIPSVLFQMYVQTYVLYVLKALLDCVSTGVCCFGSQARIERCRRVSSAGDLSTMYDIQACLCLLVYSHRSTQYSVDEPAGFNLRSVMKSAGYVLSPDRQRAAHGSYSLSL